MIVLRILDISILIPYQLMCHKISQLVDPFIIILFKVFSLLYLLIVVESIKDDGVVFN